MISLRAVLNFTELLNILNSCKALKPNWCEMRPEYDQILKRFGEAEQMETLVEGTLCSSFLSCATPRTPRLRARAGYSSVRLKSSCPTPELA